RDGAELVRRAEPHEAGLADIAALHEDERDDCDEARVLAEAPEEAQREAAADVLQPGLAPLRGQERVLGRLRELRPGRADFGDPAERLDPHAASPGPRSSSSCR